MKFYDDAHERAYNELTKDKKLDCYNKSAIYLLTMIKYTRIHIKELYSIEKKEIEFEKLAWQTGTSLNICRLALNLFNGFHGIKENEAIDYTPYNLFSNKEFIPYYFEAVKIRFEVREVEKNDKKFNNKYNDSITL